MMTMRSRVTIIIPAVVVVIVARIMSGGEGIISLGRNSPGEEGETGAAAATAQEETVDVTTRRIVGKRRHGWWER